MLGLRPVLQANKIVVKAGVASAPVAAKRVIVSIERLAGDGPLNRDIDGGQLEVGPPLVGAYMCR